LADGWGGRRPGAGRKTRTTAEEQASRRDVVLRVVTTKRWAEVVLGMVAKAASGDAKAFAELAPYVMGAKPKELTVTVDVEARIRAMAAAAGIDPDDALAEAERILGQGR
jgi:hypothetical protein